MSSSSLEVRYGAGPRRPRHQPEGRARRDRRPDRPERRGEVDDAARGHGRDPRTRRRHPPGRTVDPRPLARGDLARRRRARARGTADLRRLHRRGEPPSRPRRPQAERVGPARPGVRALSRSSTSSAAARPACSAEASSSSSRSGARSSPTRSCSSSTSPRSASRRWPWTASSRRCARSASAA